MKPWEVTVKDGVLICIIDLSIPDAITTALGVADRIKSMVMSIEMKKQMENQMKEMRQGIIKPGVVSQNGGHA